MPGLIDAYLEMKRAGPISTQEDVVGSWSIEVIGFSGKYPCFILTVHC